MKNMNSLLQKIHQAQQSHYARVEGLLSTLVHNSVDFQAQQICQKVLAYNRSHQTPTRLFPTNDKTTPNNEYMSFNSLQFNLAPPDASWDNIFHLEQNGSSAV